MRHLRFTIASDGTGSLVKVSGEVDVETAPDLLEAVRLVHECRAEDVTLDLADVDLIDSRGLATLVVAHRHLAEHGHRLRLRSARAGVASVLRVTGVADYLDHDGQLQAEP